MRACAESHGTNVGVAMVAGATHGVASAHPVPSATRRRWTGSRRRPGPGLGPGGGPPPAPTDERIDRLVERTCDELRRHGRATSNAVETADGPMSYVALETAAVRLARYLRRRRIAAGDRVALLLDRPEDALVAQLAVARIGAAWVPLDARLPDVALAAVLEAAGAGVVLTTTAASARLDRSDVDAIYLDRVRARVDTEDAQRLTADERGSVADKPAYVVVHATDRSGGAHGGLRATAVGHEAVAAFLRGAAGLLQIGAQDRVHHDPRAGSDLAVLETWLAWSCGATVVTAPAGPRLHGAELGRHLRDQRVTVLRASAEDLDGVEETLPDLRLLLLSGTDRPQALLARWQRTGRRIVGLHGAPETTVASLGTELRPDRPATLGRPLPGYGVVIADPADPRRVLPAGGIGEIAITGPGVARGYVGRRDLTAEAFVPAPGPSTPGRGPALMFRTGDLGRITPAGDVERIARLDGAGGRGERIPPSGVRPPPRSAPRRSNRTTVMTLPSPSVDEAEPAADAAAVDAPAVDAPAVDAPAVDAPAVDAPVIDAQPAVDDVAPEGTAPHPAPAAPDAADDAGQGTTPHRRPTAAATPAPAPPNAVDAPTTAVRATPPPAAPQGFRSPAPPGPRPTTPRPTTPGPPTPGPGIRRTGGPAGAPRWGPPVRQGGTVPPGAPARPGAPGRQGPNGPGPAGPAVRPPATGRPGSPPVPGPLAPSAPAAAPSKAPAAAPSGAPGATEALLREILVEILGRPDVPKDGNFFDDLGADSLLMARFCARIRKHPDLPSAAMQDIYQHPTLAKLSVALAPTQKKPDASGAARTTSGLGAVLAEVLERPDVPPHANFFEELGADSLLMARFCARTRKRDDLPSVGMPDVYRNPTIASLTAALDGGADPDRIRSGPAGPPATETEEPTGPRATTAAFVLCGAAQLACVLAYSYIAALILTWGFQAVTAATGVVEGYLAALLIGVVGFVTLSVVPIAAKWALIGRWQPGSIRVWSPAYLRFWVVKTLVRSSPMVLFTGTPAFTLYLRALGAKVGRDVVYLSSQVPVCTDLFSIGDGSLVRKESVVACYRAHDGRIEIGGVSIGAGAFVGEATVLDVRTAVGDGASLAHSSSLHAGQAIPAGEVWHGSPGRRADGPLPAVPPAPGSRSRRAIYSTVLGVFVLAVASPAALVIAGALYALVPQFAALLAPAPGALLTAGFYLDLLALSALLYFGALVLGLIVSTTVPRLFALGVRPDVVYPLYGVHYWLHRSIGALTNVKPFVELFGDSSAIAHYLGLIGYRLRPIEQTGSNFGMAVAHENPFLTSVGRGTVVADGLSVMNAEYSPTSFRVSRTAIGANNFLGNKIAYPPQGRTGDDCLLATKVAVPLHGPVRQGVGLLGSPSFEIPRTVARDSALDVADPQELAASLRRKNRHNGVSMALHLLVRWLFLYLTLLGVAVVASLPIEAGPGEVVLAELVGLVLLVGWFALVERVLSPLKSLAPQGCSIYDPAFLRHERYWKVPAPDWVQLFNGTPFKPLVWRLLGVHIGARVFDDGVNLTEKGFTTIGDDATLGEGCVVQCHSQEDGGFKSDHVAIGNRVTLGVSSFVHYGTNIGDDAILAPDTFLMKGEEVPPGESWGGNPARGSD